MITNNKTRRETKGLVIQEKVLLSFYHTGSSPQYSKGTYIPVFPTKEQRTSWEGRVTSTSDNVVTMGVTPAANCIVGKYHMYVAVMTPFGIRRTRRDRSRDLYILFNPWAAGWFRLLFSILLKHRAEA